LNSVIYTKYTSIYRLFSLSLSHFILLTWYQSHCFDFLVPTVISDVLPLPLPSSSNRSKLPPSSHSHSHCNPQI